MDTKKQAEKKANAKVLELVENDWKVARTSLSDKFIIYYEHGFKGDGTHEFPFRKIKPVPRGTAAWIRIKSGGTTPCNALVVSTGNIYDDGDLSIAKNTLMGKDGMDTYSYDDWCSVTEPEKYHSEGWDMDWIKEI